MQNYMTECYSLYKRRQIAIRFTFPGGDGGPRKWWMRGRGGDTVLVQKAISSCISICYFQQNPSFIPTISLLKGLIH